MSELKHYFAPTSLDQAVERLKNGDVTILAGGTDLTPQSQAGRIKFKQTLMNIRHVPQLSGITLDGTDIRIGALATITEIMEHPLIRKHLPVLVEACDHFASDQIRNAGTIGGNICNASPAGDMLIPLLVMDACVELASMPEAKLYSHCMPLSTFFVGPGKTRKSLCELVTGVRIPLPGPDHVAHFYKHGTRPALDISTISIGIAGTRKDGALINVRPSALWRRRRCGPRRPRRRWKVASSTKLRSKTSRRSPETKSSPSTTCAPRPGTARK